MIRPQHVRLERIRAGSGRRPLLTVLIFGPEGTSALRRELSDFGKTGTSAPGLTRRFRGLAATSASPPVSDVVGLARFFRDGPQSDIGDRTGSRRRDAAFQVCIFNLPT